jgi:hypothetical protein
MNSQSIRPLCLAVITLPVIAIGASTAGRAQSKYFDAFYKGTLECDQGGLEVFRSLLTILIRNGSVTGSDGREELGPFPVPGSGTVDPDGVFRFGYMLYASDYSLRADHSGTLNDNGGTLTGTQVLTRQITGDGGTRTCKGTFLKVELPRQ